MCCVSILLNYSKLAGLANLFKTKLTKHFDFRNWILTPFLHFRKLISIVRTHTALRERLVFAYLGLVFIIRI